MKLLLLISFFDTFLFPRNILHEDQFNPAHLQEKRFEIVLASEMRFELAELRTFGLYSQIDRYSLKATSFGCESYRENFFAFGFGFPVGGNFAVGINVAGLNVWIKDMCNEFTYGLKIGGQFENELFLISSWINNINVPRVSALDYVPLSYSVRFLYKVSSNLHFRLAVRGVEAELPFYNFGLTFAPREMLLLSLSVNSRPILLEYGLRLSLGKMFLGYSGNRHQQLGLTHSIGMGFVQ
ncbi:MAG: hypothetical protein PVH23_00240 [candidate division WOR-3 bacterium]